MNRRVVSIAVALATFALPASALAASGSGTVLSVDRSHHIVQVVDAGHIVHAYRYRVLANVKDGIRIRFRVTGKTITTVKTLGKAAAVSFYATVVRSGARAVVMRLPDGEQLTIGGPQLAHAQVRTARANTVARARANTVARARANTVAHAVTKTTARAAQTASNVASLQPGETVLVTEWTAANGSVTIVIELTGSAGGGGAGGSTVSEQQASGVVTDVETDTFQVTTGDGSVLNLDMAADTLANLNLSYCDQVTVSYHEDSGVLIADSVDDTGASTTGVCAGDGSSAASEDAVGTITSVSGSSVTIDQGLGQGALTFTVDDPSITDGFSVGDVVDVTYTEDADGTLDAGDVEYVENDATGVVTSVGAGSLTITDDSTGDPDTFTADPGAGMFDGVQIGDEVDVSYHVAAGGDVVDNVDDSGSGS